MLNLSDVPQPSWSGWSDLGSLYQAYPYQFTLLFLVIVLFISFLRGKK